MRITRFVNGKRQESLLGAEITTENKVISDAIDAVNRRILRENNNLRYNKGNGGDWNE